MVSITPSIDGNGIGRQRAGLERNYADELRVKLMHGQLLRLGAIAAQFALIVAAMALLNVESNALVLLLTVSVGGFLVNHFLPATWRQNFFAALSVASVLMVLGWGDGAWLLGMGALLIALCHLPVALRARIALLLAVAGVMVAARAHALPWVAAVVPATVWPILGSMFMFRLIVYLYDLAHGTAPFGVGRALSYFFMLPNVCFPLFPIVDYKTLQRSAYNDDALRLYQTGVKWMLRGLVHLLIYKVIYLVGVIDPSEAVDGLGAGRYMICTFLLYFKISGLFHLIVGLLHMYGYGLPETHHRYLLSSSFTDLWRRINIYWKDFMQKLVFNPVYFALRRRGETWAIAGATVIAAVVTWFFHAYQWFWIRGEFPLVLVDMLFWGGLGVCLTVNVILESRRGRPRSLEKKARTLRENALLCLKTAGTFVTIVTLWTLWNTRQLEELTFVWRALLNSGPLDVAVLLGVPLGLGVIRVLVGDSTREVFGDGSGTGTAAKMFWPQVAIVSASAGAFILLAISPSLLAPLSPRLATLMDDMHWGRLNRVDLRQLQRGYYEDLGDVARFNPELSKLYGGQPVDWAVSHSTRKRADGIQEDFIPSTAYVFKGALRTINSLGMRDREYTLERGHDTFRIALIGSSHDMGAGVKDDETYENLVEGRLNRELGPRTRKKFEILNFSYGGYTPTQKLSVIEQRMFSFQPDLILYAATRQEPEWTFNSLQHLVDNRLLDQFPEIKRAMGRAGINTDVGKALPDRAIRDRQLAPFADDTFGAFLERFRDGALSRGIKPALVIIEIPDDNPSRSPDFDRVAELAQSAQIPVLDLQGSFAGVKDRKSLWIATWDSHTNAEGHRLLADHLYSRLLREGLVPER